MRDYSHNKIMFYEGKFITAPLETVYAYEKSGCTKKFVHPMFSLYVVPRQLTSFIIRLLFSVSEGKIAKKV